MVEAPESTASGGNPRTLKAESNGLPLGPINPDYKPSTKEEGQAVASAAKDNFEAWKRSNLEAGNPVKISDGEVYRWQPEEVIRIPGLEDDKDWEIYRALQSDPNAGKWVLDTEGQLLYDHWQELMADAKEAGAGMGAARSYLDVEADKTKEITRQFKDFENRASLLYDLMADEQDYGFSADKHNFDAWDAQRDLGLATMPGGFAGKPSMAMSLSSILRPSLPDYVRPDYRLNAAVGLPGPQGFDDPDYGPDGLPLYARGTDEFIRIPLKPLAYWPWSGRNGS